MLVLIFAPSGVGLREIKKKLEHVLKQDAKIVDIEEKLCSDSSITKKLLNEGRIKPSETLTMLKVVKYLPRDEVIKGWERAISNALTEMRNFNGIKIITGHALYYNSEYREFYSPLIPNVIRELSDEYKLELKKIALLIDDFPDMFQRLSYDGGLFDRNSLKRFRDRASQNSGSLDSNLIRIQWKKDAVDLLFQWRYTELILLDNHAVQLGADFMLWGVKNKLSAFIDWIRDNSIAVYLSHPISDVREQQTNNVYSKNWPAITEEINNIPNKFNRLSIIMPTAIDELRFELLGKVPSGKLAARWPLMKNGDLIYSYPSKTGNAPEYSDFFTKNLKTSGIEKEISMIVNDLKNSVDLQVSARDHLLVYRSKGIIVYRPFWNKNKTAYSQGVRSELTQWNLTASENKRAVFIHFNEETKNIIEGEKQELINNVKASIRQRISSEITNNPDQLNHLMDAFFSKTNSIVSSTLGGGVEQEYYNRLHDQRDKWLTEAIRGVLFSKFSGGDIFGKNLALLKKQQACIFLDRFDQLSEHVESITTFLRNGDDSIKDTLKDHVETLKTWFS
ncbi:MAG: hypothetical protein QW478_12725 [Candidatus Micrarchaeaceae archaeon]